MTDQELELRLRGWYRAEVGETETAPVVLRTSVAAIARGPSGQVRALGRPRPLVLLAAAAGVTLLVGGAIAVGSGLVRLPSLLPGPAPTTVPSSVTSPTPTLSTEAPVATWIPAARMLANHGSGVTATLLDDGRVLVVGGRNGPEVEGSAELYDPGSGRWTSAGTPRHTRVEPTATLLPDGTVLVAGGYDPNGRYLASAELYDPVTGRWTETGAMTRPRSGHTATPLLDGPVLVVGGEGTEGSAELYDPRSGRWAATGNPTEHRDFATATLLDDGRVLLAGGATDDTGSRELASAELYDPSTGTWAATGDMTLPRTFHIATRLGDGRVLVAGGATSLDAQFKARTADLFDPGTGLWTRLPGTMIGLRSFETATLLRDGTVLVAGGASWIGQPYGQTSAELFDPSANAWTVTASMTDARTGHAAALLDDGTVLVVGGDGIGGGVSIQAPSLASAEIYRPGTASAP